MKQGTTVYLYELAWILPSIAIPVGMLVALVVTAFGVGVHLPSDAGRVEPTKVAETPPFDKPGVFSAPDEGLPRGLAPDPRASSRSAARTDRGGE